MNSLNIVSRLGLTPPPSPPRSRSGSTSQGSGGERANAAHEEHADEQRTNRFDQNPRPEQSVDEKTPLLNEDARPRDSEWRLPKRITEAVFYGVRAICLTVTAPFRYVLACLYDEDGAFSALLPLISLKNLVWRRKRRPAATEPGGDSRAGAYAFDEKGGERATRRKASKQRAPSADSRTSSATGGTSDGEAEDTPARNTRSKTSSSSLHPDDGGDNNNPLGHRKSIRIKVASDETLRKRKASKGGSSSKRNSAAASPDDVALVASALKSPSSLTHTHNSSKLTRYPRAPAPPRPLVPRRQPSYAPAPIFPPGHDLGPRKTLIIDLDETLIHSMAKGGRMSQGHMVEVRLGGPVASSAGGGVQLGAGVPILYYVHERPGCHEFLRKVCKWFNLIVFTASVQEYADPVIDWLERERKYFSGRFYRQHCTFRNGAYIKDLAQVEPDLSKVMILDNSPMSYIFHEGESASNSLSNREIE